jgi:hypothetical protein
MIEPYCVFALPMNQSQILQSADQRGSENCILGNVGFCMWMRRKWCWRVLWAMLLLSKGRTGWTRARARAKEQHMKKIAALSLGLLSFSATSVFAHPGEHAFSFAASLYHLMTEPDHLAMMAAAAAVAFGFWRWRKTRA